MRALVISDTHVKQEADFKALHEVLEPFLGAVDVIIHAGDAVAREAIDFFKKLKPVYMVRGNMDAADAYQALPEKLVFELGGEDRVDTIIFGHSHRPLIGRIEGVLMLNPGSPTDTRFADRNTVAIL